MGKVSSEGDVQKWCRAAHCFSSKTTRFLLRASIPCAERGAGREGEASESLSWPPAWISRGNTDPTEGPVARRGDPCCKGAGHRATLPDAAVWMCSRRRTGTQRGAPGGHGLGGTVSPVRGPWAAQSDMGGTHLL